MSTITELFQKQADNFSDRPRWPMAELLGRTENVGFTYYGTRLKQKRTLLQTEFGSNKRNQWGPMLENAASEILSSWSDPETNGGNEARKCLRRTIESLIFRLTYGFEPSRDVIELIQLVGQQTGQAFQPGRWAVNSFPLLSYIPYWMPGAGFQRWARSSKSLFMKMVRDPYNKTKNDLLSDPEVSCFVANHLRVLRNSGLAQPSLYDEQLIMSTAGSVFAGNITLAAVETILMLLSRHPEKQDVAYREIARLERLPSISCIFKEGLRINPPVPLLTHSPIESSQYKGWLIPKGSWVLANICGARAVAAFSIEPLDDARSDIEFTTGLNSGPKEFSCKFVRERKLNNVYCALTSTREILLYDIIEY
ncbi:cytochrome P450 [Gymnopilus junonius]|uniref:Cytochrome P450 n=1 Tax=Gymnopilus junonius TaxID=109634 RepID=A0A9P5NIC4_GYMJU|nr:cytochrome P450 [Gymnopilus junonius]